MTDDIEQAAVDFWTWFRLSPHSECRDTDCQVKLAEVIRAEVEKAEGHCEEMECRTIGELVWCMKHDPRARIAALQAQVATVAAIVAWMAEHKPVQVHARACWEGAMDDIARGNWKAIKP